MASFHRNGGSSDQETIYESAEYEDQATEENKTSSSLPFNLTNNENILQSSLNPTEAFQYFQQFRIPIEGKHYFQTNTKQKHVLETPWEKYYRLRSELEELKTSLNAIETIHDAKKNSIWSLLQEKTETLVGEAETMKGHAAWKLIPSKDSSNAADTSSVSADLLKEIIQKLPTNNAASGAGKETAEEGRIEMIQTIYNKIAGNYTKRLLNLESKITYLETLLGVEMNYENQLTASSSSSSLSGEKNSMFPIVSTINKLEQKLNLLDIQTSSSNFESYRSKLSILKVELEHVTSSGANTVDSGNNASSSSQVLDMYHKIEHFLDQFSLIQSMIHEIPTIIVRLKTLENIHWNANMFTTRLDGLETEIGQINQDLQSNKQVLTELKSQLSENFAALKDSIEKGSRQGKK